MKLYFVKDVTEKMIVKVAKISIEENPTDVLPSHFLL